MEDADKMLGSRFSEAMVYARELHGRQTRKGTGIPYLAHLMSVAAIVLEHGGTEDEAIAGLLHDAVEDQGGSATLAKIERRFGADVAAIVEGCTDTDETPKPPWHERKRAYIGHLPQASASVRLVSAADKLHNARAILTDYREVGDELWSRFNVGRLDVLWYYRALADAFTGVVSTPLTRELERTVAELEREAG